VTRSRLDTIGSTSPRSRRTAEKIARQYVQKGFYLAPVDYEITRSTRARSIVWSRSDEKARSRFREVQFIGEQQHLRDDCAAGVADPGEDSLSLKDSGVYSQEAFERDRLIISGTTGIAATRT